jgi:hypothetical protein
MSIDDIDRRLAANLDMIMGEISAPPRSRFERALLVLRVPEPTARLIAATPVLRWSWFAAVGVALLFAASAGSQQWRPGDQLAVFLALAPVVPVIGVAFAYGPSADRSYEVQVAAPLSGLRLVLLRSLTVVVAAAAVSLLWPHRPPDCCGSHGCCLQPPPRRSRSHCPPVSACGALPAQSPQRGCCWSS